MTRDGDHISLSRTQEKRRVMHNGESIRCCASCDYVYTLADLAVVCDVYREHWYSLDSSRRLSETSIF